MHSHTRIDTHAHINVNAITKETLRQRKRRTFTERSARERERERERNASFYHLWETASDNRILGQRTLTTTRAKFDRRS